MLGPPHIHLNHTFQNIKRPSEQSWWRLFPHFYRLAKFLWVCVCFCPFQGNPSRITDQLNQLRLCDDQRRAATAFVRNFFFCSLQMHWIFNFLAWSCARDALSSPQLRGTTLTSRRKPSGLWMGSPTPLPPPRPTAEACNISLPQLRSFPPQLKELVSTKQEQLVREAWLHCPRGTGLAPLWCAAIVWTWSFVPSWLDRMFRP